MKESGVHAWWLRPDTCALGLVGGFSNAPLPPIHHLQPQAFITQFSQCLSHELREFGVDVLVVTPYYVISNQVGRRARTTRGGTAVRSVSYPPPDY